MGKIVIFTAAAPDAAANLKRSVLSGVSQRVVTRSARHEGLTQHYGADPVRMWGSPTGDRGRKRSVWKKIEPPAVAFFYSAGRFTVSARIWGKEPLASDGQTGNPALARSVWSDPSFEHIVYLDEIEEIDVSSNEMKTALGYESAYLIGREFMVPSDAIERRVLDAFGSPEAFRRALATRAGAPTAAGSAAAPPATLGSPYRVEDESRTADRKPLYSVDPDVVDRGTKGHAKTQNALAAHLSQHGFAPRSWSVAEPFYDLAWERDGEIWVAEVKSLTPRNEERQLRFAVGQVLRYAQQLTNKGKPVVTVIATEREPSDGSWKTLCASLGIKLVWPSTFGDLT
jgi:hypothetical protein